MEKVRRTPEDEGDDILPGMRLSGLNDEVFGEIVSIYRDVAGIRGSDPATYGINPEENLRRALELLRSEHDATFTYGSLFSGNSQLCIRRVNRRQEGIGPAVTFSFVANLAEAIDAPDYHLTRAMEVSFKSQVTKFLRARRQYVALTRARD